MNNMQAPGQAAPAALPTMLARQNGATPIAETPMYADKALGELILQFQQQPTVPLLSVITQKTKALSMAEAKRQQDAMSANAQQGPQTIAQQGLQAGLQALAQSQGGIQALASGGPVQSFAEGGAPWYMRGSKDYDDARRFGIDLSPYDSPAERAEKFRQLAAMREWENTPKGEIPTAPTMGQRVRPPAYPADESRPGPQALERAVRTAPGRAAPAAPAAAAAPGRAAPAAGGIAAVAKPDKLSEIEDEYEAANKGLQALLQQQGQVDPELARLRQAAYESAQGIATRRERDRLAALETAQKATTAPLLSNQQALLEMAAAASGKKRIGEALGAAAGAAGKIRGEQGKALEAAQKMSREEQNAIDELNQALARKRVADRGEDVDRQRQAAIAVEQAKANLADKRLGVHTQRATEADRAEQRKIAREQIAAQLQAARENAAARAEGFADPRKVYDTIIDNVQKEYDAWAKTVEGVRSTPQQKAAKRQELLDRQVRIAAAAGVKGLEPLIAAGAVPTAAAPLGWGKATEVK